MCVYIYVYICMIVYVCVPTEYIRMYSCIMTNDAHKYIQEKRAVRLAHVSFCMAKYCLIYICTYTCIIYILYYMYTYVYTCIVRMYIYYVCLFKLYRVPKAPSARWKKIVIVLYEMQRGKQFCIKSRGETITTSISSSTTFSTYISLFAFFCTLLTNICEQRTKKIDFCCLCSFCN